MGEGSVDNGEKVKKRFIREGYLNMLEVFLVILGFREYEVEFFVGI